MTLPKITIGLGSVSIDNVCEIALGKANVQLDSTPAYIQTIDRGAEYLAQLLESEGVVYGVTTGYGDSCTVNVPLDKVDDLPRHLYTFHGCGLGDYFSPEVTRAILVTRLVSLAKGFSGVRYRLLQQIETLLQHDILPLIPEEGSVGASGDLTPLSYVAAVLCGEREVRYQNQTMATSQAFELAGVEAIQLKPKEGLALMNGTAVMTALACLAVDRMSYLCRLASRITALNTVAMLGNANHFSERLFEAKPHPGQGQIAAWIREDLGNREELSGQSSRLQDRYSLRCAPHVIGVAQDALPFWQQQVTTELNSANDNPIVDAEFGRVLHGGHFYGGHIAMVMDSVKSQAASIADLLDRQMAQISDPKFNHGLPANVSGAEGDEACLHHGMKAVQIGVSAWTAEALSLTMPVTSFSRSTECHNQDKVSMGTIAARQCVRVLSLAEQAATATLMAAVQGVRLRERAREVVVAQVSPQLHETVLEVDAIFPMLEMDRRLDHEMRTLLQYVQAQQVSVPTSELEQVVSRASAAAPSSELEMA